MRQKTGKLQNESYKKNESFAFFHAYNFSFLSSKVPGTSYFLNESKHVYNNKNWPAMYEKNIK